MKLQKDDKPIRKLLGYVTVSKGSRSIGQFSPTLVVFNLKKKSHVILSTEWSVQPFTSEEKRWKVPRSNNHFINHLVLNKTIVKPVVN